MCNADADARRTIAEFSPLARHLDVSQSSEQELKALLSELRVVQRCVEGLIMRVGAQANVLASGGQAAPAVEILRSDGAVGAGRARREAARVETAAIVSGLGDAVVAGELSGEHVDVLARHTLDLDGMQQAALDADALVSRAKELPPETFGRLVKRTVEAVMDDHGLTDTVAKQAASEFRHWFDERAGMGRFCGSLDPERYETLVNSIDSRTSSLAAIGGAVKNKNLAAQALVELVVKSGDERSTRDRMPSVTVLVDQQTLVRGPHAASIRQTESGHDVAAVSLARICCDAVIRRVTLDNRGVPIDVGRKHRTATDGQWAAIKAMYSSCAWDGCPSPIRWCQAHHIVEWEHGGRTDLSNLVPLCSIHHHRVHEGGWHVRLKPDRRLVIHRPDGNLHSTVPPPSRCKRGETCRVME